VTLIFVVLAGVVNVPGEVKTCIVVNPLAAAEEVHAVPFEVKTLPAVPTEDKPVPPSAATRGVVKSIAGDVIPLVPSMVTGMVCS
jgi:hypothetical protein